MNLDIIDTDTERAACVAVKLTITKMYDTAKEFAFSQSSNGQVDFFRLPNVEVGLVYVRNNMLYGSCSSGFTAPTVFLVHADNSLPDYVDGAEVPGEDGECLRRSSMVSDDDSCSNYSLRSVNSSLSSSGGGRLGAAAAAPPKMKFDIPRGTKFKIDIDQLFRRSIGSHLSAPTAPHLTVVIASPTFWNVLPKQDVAEMLKWAGMIDRIVTLRTGMTEDLGVAVTRFRALRQLIKQCQSEEKRMTALAKHLSALGRDELPNDLMMSEDPDSSPPSLPTSAPGSRDEMDRRLRNFSQDVCTALYQEAVLRCGSDEANVCKCAVALVSIRLDRV
jgi:hypothetical protein